MECLGYCSVILPLPGYDHLGRKVYLGRFGACDPEKFDVNDMTAATLMIFDVQLDEDEQSTVTGTVLVTDASGMTMAHMVHYTPAVMKKSMVLWQVRETSVLNFFFFLL